MTDAEKTLARIEQIVADIESVDRSTGGKFRQAEDREAFDIIARIQRKMAQKVEVQCDEIASHETVVSNGGL